jgi:iron-sulfur cluster repair protein YtfE (RIC family)
VDRILEEISTMKRRALQHTKAVFARSKHGLLRHMAWEEELLFPVCEQKVQRHDTGPTAGMRQEHAQITAALEKMGQSLAAGELTALNTAERDLVEVLTIHNRKEEQMLYPMLNHSLSPEERKALLDKFR